MFKEELISILQITSRKKKRRESFSIHFMKLVFMLIPKPEKDYFKILQTALMHVNEEIVSKVLANRIQQYIRRII